MVGHEADQKEQRPDGISQKKLRGKRGRLRKNLRLTVGRDLCRHTPKLSTKTAELFFLGKERI